MQDTINGSVMHFWFKTILSISVTHVTNKIRLKLKIDVIDSNNFNIYKLDGGGGQ